MILVKNVLDRIKNVYIDDSSGRVGYSFLLDCMFLLVLFVLPFSVVMDGWRLFINPTAMLRYI